MSELAKKKCIPCSGDIPALKDDEITELKKKWHFHLNVVKNNIEIDKTGGVTLIFSKVKKRL